MTFKCDQCYSYFTTKRSLNRHITKKRCSKYNLFYCNICNINFTKMKYKKKHDSIVHSGDNNEYNICNICGKTFQHQKTLKRHLNTHKARKMKFTYYDNENEVIIPNELYSNKLAINEIKEHWSAIRNFKIVGEHKLRHVYNIRLENSNFFSIKDKITEVLQQQIERYKINVSFGSLLYNIEDNEVRYFHASQNNFLFFEQPKEIGNNKQQKEFIQHLFNKDIHDLSLLKRENTKWKLLYITNVTIYIFRFASIPFGCLNYKEIPTYILKNKGINVICKSNGNLCFFECLAQYQKKDNIISSSRELCELYTKTLWTQFTGVKIDEIGEIEKHYNIPIFLYHLEKENKKIKSILIRRSPLKSNLKPLNINIYRNHFFFIHDLEKFSKWMSCKHCSKIFKSKHKSKLIKHEYNCSSLIKEFFPGGMYKEPKNIFQLLENEGIVIPKEKREYKYRIFYDCESILIPLDNCSLNSKTTLFTSRHELISIAYISNVPGFESTQCFVREQNETSEKFIEKIFNKLKEISKICKEINTKKYEIYLYELEKLIDSYDEISKKYVYLKKLLSYFLEYISQIPILAFNGKRYDLPLFLSELISFFLKSEKKKPNVIKHHNEYKAILTENFRFLDISNYLSPGISYSQYLKAFNIEESKFFFPYEYLTSIDKLSETSLPPHSAFYSSLKQCNISYDEYEFCKLIWEKNNMKTLKDFLIYYNTLDVAPGLKAIEKHMDLLYKLNVDPLKESFSISGVAFLYLFRKKYLPFPIFNNGNLFNSLKNSLIGGPSIIFKRYAKINETVIKPHKYHENAKLVKKIIGFDANSLYLSVLKNTLPTGFMIHRTEPFFYPKIINSQSFSALCWIEYISQKENVKIYHALYLGEIKITSKNIPVDGYYISDFGIVCLQFHGCFIHGHDCYKNKKYSRNDIHPFKIKKNLTFNDVYNITLESDNLIIKEGYILKKIWECEWEEIQKNNIIAKNIKEQMMNKKSKISVCSQSRLIKAIKNENIFGILECDINVPINLRKDFDEMTPIFKNANISINDIGDNMRKYCIDNDLMKNSRKQLIGSYFGEKMWIMSPLAKWYLDKGLEISKIYQFLEFDNNENFSEVVDEIIKYRRLGDIDKKYEMIGGIFKLIGNSIYGKSILNKNKLRKTTYCFNQNLEKHIISPVFMNLNEIGNDICEIEMNPKRINQNVPLVLGFSILNYAKGVLLSFFYDFIKKYIPDNCFELMETDTDSLYICLSENSIHKLIPDDKKNEFYNELRDWMPVLACDYHYDLYISAMCNDTEWNPEKCCILEYKRESRTPGKWKIEAEGDEMICLNSKSYILHSEKNKSKLSTKGLSKTNKFNIDDFSHVLNNKISKTGVNRGFKITPNKLIFTYEQQKSGLSYLYIKRKVLKDGITTIPLDI